MACYGGLWGILTGLSKLQKDHPAGWGFRLYEESIGRGFLL